MQTFFVGVLIAALQDPKVQAFIKKLFGEAVDTLRADLAVHVAALEKSVLDRIERLPGEILGNASKDVGILLHEITGTKDDIAGAVKDHVQPLLPTVDSLQQMFTNALKDLPGGGFLDGLLGGGR